MLGIPLRNPPAHTKGEQTNKQTYILSGNGKQNKNNNKKQKHKHKRNGQKPETEKQKAEEKKRKQKTGKTESRKTEKQTQTRQLVCQPVGIAPCKMGRKSSSASVMNFWRCSPAQQAAHRYKDTQRHTYRYR